jgi:APA family basic amino acid/polyamine antiporter
VFVSTPLGKEPGGEYAHISRTLGGYRLAFIGVWLKIISYIGALAYLSRAFADYLGGGMPVAVAILLFFYAIHVVGVRWFGRIQVWMCIILGLSLIVLIVPGLFAIRPANYRPFFTRGFGGFAASLPPLFFAYAGFESLAQTAGEVRDSTHRLPRIFLLGITATMIIYLLMSIVAIGVLPGQSMTAVASRYLPRGAEVIITIGALMAITTSLNATMIVPSRVTVMLAEDRLAPRWLGSVSPWTGTPIVGLTVTAVAALILLLSGEVGLALNIAVFALVVLYLLHSYALLVLPRKNPGLFKSVTVRIPLWVQRASAIVSMIAMGGIIALQLTSIATVELAAIWAAVGALIYAIANRGAARRIENADESKLV